MSSVHARADLSLALMCAVVALALAFLVGLSAGDGGTVSDAPVEDVATAALAAVDQTNMQAGTGNTLKRLYGLDPDSFDGYALWYPTSNIAANELLVIKLASTDQQQAVREAMEARRDAQLTSFDGYGIGQYEMLEASVIDVNGNYALFVVADDPKAADAAFLGAL